MDMGSTGALTGISLGSLQDAFSGSEDILQQMLGLFEVQARERMAQLRVSLAAWDVMATRQCLHSLVNISGAVHAYGMSEQTKALGDAVKQDDRLMAEQLLGALAREADLVLRQTSVLLAALDKAPASVWSVALPD
jgi:HPt (histidine-containing phosphotransfer) domain-containing protein